MKGMKLRHLLPLLLLASALPAYAQVDDPMIRWDCDPDGHKFTLEMVQIPVAEVTARELILFNGMVHFEQCRLGGANWTLLVDVVEYASGRCEMDPDTIVSLLRNDQLVIASAVIGYNCGDRPVLSAARISEAREGGGPQLELCTASKYGEASRCSAFEVRKMTTAIDNDAVAAHARGP